MEPCLMYRGEYFREPQKPLPVQQGFNCVVEMKVGDQKVLVTLDSGASRNIARTEFVEKLRKAKKTKESVEPKQELPQVIQCTGIQGGMNATPMEFASAIAVTMKSPSDGTPSRKQVTESVVFGELERAADPLLIGFPQLARWGFELSVDAGGKIWVTLAAFDVRFVAMSPVTRDD